jgi:hypothetical protein
MAKTPTPSNPQNQRGAERARQHAATDRLPHEGQGIVRTDRGEEQPADQARAQQAPRANPGDGPPRADSQPDGPKRG